MTGLEGLDFTLPPELMNPPKRSHEHQGGAHDDSEAKRLKTEAAGVSNPDDDDNALEDNLALLVQNALSNVGDLVSQFDSVVADSGDPMDIDAAALLESVGPLHTFFSDPLKYVCNIHTHTLGSLVGLSMKLTIFSDF